MHGLIFFYIQKYAESLPQGLGSAAGHGSGQSSIVRQAAHYLPSASYPDDEAVALLQAVAAAEGAPLGETVRTSLAFANSDAANIRSWPAWRVGSRGCSRDWKQLVQSAVSAGHDGATRRGCAG